MTAVTQPLPTVTQAEQDEIDGQVEKWRAREERIAQSEAAQRALLLERQEELQRKTAQATLEMQEETLRRSKSLAERQVGRYDDSAGRSNSGDGSDRGGSVE